MWVPRRNVSGCADLYRTRAETSFVCALGDDVRENLALTRVGRYGPEEIAAIEALDGAEWMGRALKVNKAKPKEDRGGSSGGRQGNNSGGYSRRY